MATDTYVHVRDEPRHRRRFENDAARVYDVLIPAGDTTLYHHHTEDTFYVAVNEATVRDQRWGDDDARTGTAPAGSLLCRPHRERPLIHQVSNVGGGEMRLIGAEIKATPTDVATEPLSATGYELSLERDRLRAYDLRLGAGESTGAVTYGFSGLFVMLSVCTLLVDAADGPSHISIHAPGDVVWRDGPFTASITNVGEEPCHAVLGEWC